MAGELMAVTMWSTSSVRAISAATLSEPLADSSHSWASTTFTW